MSMKLKSVLKICIALSMLAFPAMAAFDGGNGSTNMMPTLSQAWGGLPSFLKEKITWIIGLSMIALIVSGVLYSFLGGGQILWAGQRDAAGRSSGISNVILGVAVIFGAIIAVSIIFWLVS